MKNVKNLPKAKAIAFYGGGATHGGQLAGCRAMAARWQCSPSQISRLPDPLPLHWSAAVQADMDSEKKK